eukprot:m.87041 g.87041  ORF g.87041 m.87041 type:complete len:175 (+) comp16385_c0_seq1:67-591(+)
MACSLRRMAAMAPRFLAQPCHFAAPHVRSVAALGLSKRKLSSSFVASEECRFTASHEWLKLGDDDVATMGITTFAQEALGDIVYVELPDVDTELDQDDVCGAVESVKAASDIYAPVSGVVLETNETLDDEPQLINEDAEGKGWILKIKMSNKEQFNGMMDKETYEAHCKANSDH